MLGRVAKSAGNLSTGLKARKIPLLSGKESQKESDAHFYRVCNQRNLDLPPRLLISTEANLAERKHRNVPKRFPPTVIIIIPTVKSSKKKRKKNLHTNKISYRFNFLFWISCTKSSNIWYPDEPNLRHKQSQIKNKNLLSSLVLPKWKIKRPDIVSYPNESPSPSDAQNRVTLSEKNHGAAGIRVNRVLLRESGTAGCGGRPSVVN